MRNLKRALSLALASVMLMGMMVVGTSAASFPDVDDEDNIEAIDVLETVQVMIGDEGTGEFRPDDPVNRAEMAVVMAKLLNLDYNYYVTSCPFTDVSGNYEWAKGWVGACAANGIVSGRGEGIFDPGATVTAVEAASMMMRALGYFQHPGDYSENGGFETATVKQASQIGLFSGINGNARDAMNRNQVAKLALNALESNMVYFSGDVGFDFNGVTVGYRSQYTYRTGTESKYAAISGLGDATVLNGTQLAQGQHYVNLGEQLYDGDLKLYDNRVDVFGRPSRRWEYNGKAIGTYIKKDQLKEEYTEKVTGKALYELLGKDVVDDYTFTITIDGETSQEVLNSVANGQKDQYFFNKSALNRTNTNQVGGTGNGVLTQVFVDGGNKQVYIAIINTYLAKAEADYNARRDEASFTIWNVAPYSKGSVKALVKDGETNTTGVKVSGDDFTIEDVKADDIFLVHVAENEIKEFITPEIVDDATISAFKNGSYVVADKQYDYASAARYDDETLNQYANTNMKDTTYRIFLDTYGYLIGIEKVESEDHYVFLTGINSYNENLKDQTAIGNVIFLDGTSKNVTINMKDSKNAEKKSFSEGTSIFEKGGTGTSSNPYYSIRKDTGVSSLMNTWCTYSVDEDNVYTLKEVANTAATVSGAKLGQSHMGGTYKDGASSETRYYSTGAADPAASTGDAGFQKVAASTNASNKQLGYGVTSPSSLADGTNAEYVTIDKGHVSLDGIANSTAYKKVYGNNDTVYLSAELDIINAKRGWHHPDATRTEKSVIITGASSVSTGVQNVDLNAWNAQAVVNNEDDFQENDMFYTNVSEGVYTLFNDKGYVIAAMVVGEDDGSSTSYAWVSSGNMNREGLVNGKWEYSRDVIVDGKEATLIEVESNGTEDPSIGNDGGQFTPATDEPGSVWWAVRSKGDGTVKDVTKITTSKAGSYVYASDIKLIDPDETTVLSQSFAASDHYDVKVTGNTLQVESRTGEIRGFAVKADASIAVVKDELIYRNGVSTGEYNYKENIEYFTNGDKAEGLKQAVGLIQDEDFNGYIAAILKDGRAECVIIYDKAEADVDIGGVGGADVDISEYPMGTLNITSTRTLTAREVNAIIMDFLDKGDIDRVQYSAKDNQATIYWNDGTGDTTYKVNVNKVASQAEVAGAELVNKIQNQIGDKSTTGAEVEIDGNKITTKPGNDETASTKYVTEPGPGTDGTSDAVKDLVGFLVKLHDNGAKEIKFNDVTYKWNTGIRFASKWLKDGALIGTPNPGEPNTATDTLAKAIEETFTDQIRTIKAADVAGTYSVSATIIVDGAEMVIAIDFVMDT